MQKVVLFVSPSDCKVGEVTAFSLAMCRLVDRVGGFPDEVVTDCEMARAWAHRRGIPVRPCEPGGMSPTATHFLETEDLDETPVPKKQRTLPKPDPAALANRIFVGKHALEDEEEEDVVAKKLVF